MQRPSHEDFLLKKMNPHVGWGKVTAADPVEQMQYLYAHVVKARDLPAKGVNGSIDPYVTSYDREVLILTYME